MSWSQEFQTVDLIVKSSAETRGVDAFALALIKSERQIRRLVTHLVYQFSCFNTRHIPELRETLNKNRGVYFEGLTRGFDALYIRSLRELIGIEYERLLGRLEEASRYRNKIFHGQLTSDNLSREQLLGFVKDISFWCQELDEAAIAEFGRGGFDRNSFQKSNVPDLHMRLKVQFSSMNDYAAFIAKNMERRRP